MGFFPERERGGVHRFFIKSLTSFQSSGVSCQENSMNLKHTNNFVQKLTRSFINPLNVITLTLDPRYITVVHVLKQSGVV